MGLDELLVCLSDQRHKFGEGNTGFLDINDAEDALAADLHLQDKAHLTAYIRNIPTCGAIVTVSCSQRGRSHTAVEALQAC